MRLAVKNADLLLGVGQFLVDEFKSQNSRIRAGWSVEHDIETDGHTNVSAYSLSLSGDTPPTTSGTLYRDGDALYWNGVLVSSGTTSTLGGSGTSGTLAKWTGTSTVGNSIATESGTTITVAGTVAATALLANTAGLSVSVTTPSILAPADLSLAPTGSIVTAKNLIPDAAYTRSIGTLSNKYLMLHAAELWVETLVAQNTIATIGGRVLIGPTNVLIAAVGTGDTTIDVKYNNYANGDCIYFEANGAVEFMAVTSSSSVITGGYRYSVTRNLDGSGANAWSAGDAGFNTGTTGNGFIDLYSLTGVLSGTGPTIVGNVRTGTAYNAYSPRWAIGNLNGLYGYGSDTYGAAFGTSTAAWLKIDPTNGVRIGHNSTTLTQIDASGNASFTGTVTAAAGAIGGWTIGASTLTGGNATLASSGNLTLGTSNDVVRLSADDATYRLWAGHATAGSAPFRVTKAGAVTASNITITGSSTINITPEIITSGNIACLAVIATAGASFGAGIAVVTGASTFGGLVSRGTVSAGSAFWALDLGGTGILSIGGTGTGTNSHVLFNNANGQIGSISTNGTTTSYNTTSDATLKQHLYTVTEPRLANLTVRAFKWLTDGRISIGVFAQDAYDTHPEAVTPGDKTRPWMVDYSKLVPDLIVGWQNHETRLHAVERALGLGA